MQSKTKQVSKILPRLQVAEDAPHLFPLSSCKQPVPAQGLAFLPHKNAVAVREVEFARGYRLTATTITPISFTVPRVKAAAYFQVRKPVFILQNTKFPRVCRFLL